ncbi:MAG: ABC transporter permease [Hyphomicrobiales bacterium]|nr:MAG: ABC transporter permease [Hyphomicrobiales bacterium]
MTALEAPAPRKARWTKIRILGWGVMSVFAIAGFFLLRMVVLQFDPDLLSRYGPKLLEGLVVTLTIVAISVGAGALLSFPVAMARMSSSRFLQAISYGYVYFFRGTPLLAQVFLIYYGAGQFRDQLEAVGLWDFFAEAFWCVLFTFTLNTAAYQAEILRGAIQSVPRGQTEAAQSLGLKPVVIFFRIIVPQALIIALRPLGNEIILMIKGSAIASVVTVFDLMGATKLAFSRSFDFQVFIWAAILYLVMVETLRRIWNRLEKRLTRHLKMAN